MGMNVDVGGIRRANRWRSPQRDAALKMGAAVTLKQGEIDGQGGLPGLPGTPGPLFL